MPDEPAKTGGRRKNGQFAKGSSGNPKGRPAGSRHSVSVAIERLFEGEAEALTRIVIQQALRGDGQALRMCLERLCPPPKERPVRFALPKVEITGDHPRALAALLAGMAQGELAPGEAGAFAKLVEAHSTALGMVELESRVAALEDARK